MNPLDNITDPYKFQQIVAEYFNSIKRLRKYHVDHIDVDNNGVGGDDGCDIVVEFFYEDTIARHSHKWVIECKSQKQAVSARHIPINSIDGVLSANNAEGYLLICRNDATASLKRTFKSMSNNTSNKYKYIAWNGSQLWHKFIESKSLIKSFFPDYYKEYFIKNNAEKSYSNLVAKYNKELKGAKKS